MNNNVIAKRYVKAILSSFNDKELSAIEDTFSNLNKLFSDQKFFNVILSPTINREEKCKFILSLVDKKDKKVENLISILSINDRLNLIPLIYNELKLQISKISNTYEGRIITNSTLSDKQVSTLEKKLSSKFDANIKLKTVSSDYPGIKIELDDLGVEASFSLDRLKTQITEYILKAI